ncbi:hypothetical protein Angca_001145 [Angiostrongylus cantonensis]|nr:hypothetical protein Angca_001145 [Angiostrongylus cantonensis]
MCTMGNDTASAAAEEQADRSEPSSTSRSEKKSRPLSTNSQDVNSPERNHLKARDGFIYVLVTIDNVEGQRFGLGIKHCQDQVLVSKSEEGSMCANRLKVLDHIVDVNGTSVVDRDVCRNLLIKSMQDTNKVTVLVERPMNQKAIAAVKDLLGPKYGNAHTSSSANIGSLPTDSQSKSLHYRATNPHDPEEAEGNTPTHLNTPCKRCISISHFTLPVVVFYLMYSSTAFYRLHSSQLIFGSPEADYEKNDNM